METKNLKKDASYKGKRLGIWGWVFWWDVHQSWAFEAFGQEPVAITETDLSQITNLKIQ